ncbi:MAG: hypothetical protein IJ572_03425 [Bacilli bacterium]|nr:hypothetical protein [Bacilli bacterium]
MVFITLGTQDKAFPRLLNEVDELIENGLIEDSVVAQIGSTKYSSENMQIFKYMEREDLLDYIENSEYIICHAGVGTIIDSLNRNKRVIAVPRLKKYKEHVNDHQIEIVKEFSKMGLIIDGSKDLAKAIAKVKYFKPKKYKSNTKNFISIIEDFIENK